uniref:Uncharacterized protein n=1 Tax=Oryza nivara TaxID=4536 RepID=A0A0E0HCN2_ORYNI
MAAADAVAPDDGDHAVLRDDECGIPRSLSLLAALVEAEALCHATAADADADSDLIRAFRGGATPTVRIGEFLERIHTFIQQESVRHVIEIQGACYVLAGIYLIRFIRSGAAREAGILFDWFCRVLERGPRPSGRCGGGGAGRKRTAAEAVEGEAEDGRRRVRASLPPPSVVAN